MSTAGVPMSKAQPPPPDLRRARERVLEIAAGSATVPGQPTVDARTALRPLPAELAAKLAHPSGPPGRPRSLHDVAAPATLLAALDAAGVVVAAVTGHVLLAVGAALLFVVFAFVAFAGWRSRSADPTALTAADRREIARPGHWESPHPWTGGAATGPERGLVFAAADAARRIADSPALRPALAALSNQPTGVDLVAELNHIDSQAHSLAEARGGAEGAGDRAASAAESEAESETVLTRVAALTAYADELDAVQRRRADAQARQYAALDDTMIGLDGAASGELTALMWWFATSTP